MIFRLGELFCGPGGIGWGATHADIGNEEFGIIHQWANDFDESTCRTYTRNICPDAPESVYCEDVHTLDLTQLGAIDALAFGFPCNDFSLVGSKLGFKGKYGPLYTYGIEVLKMYRPMWFLAENVGGLRSANEGKAFDKILSDMKEAGYRIYPNLYKFEEYGIPQARHRIIIIGIRDDLPYEFRIPAPTGEMKTCRQAIEEPPIPADAYNNEPTKQSEKVVKRLNLIEPGQEALQQLDAHVLELAGQGKVRTSDSSNSLSCEEWHNLQKDPFDVPQKSGTYLVIAGFGNFDYAYVVLKYSTENANWKPYRQAEPIENLRVIKWMKMPQLGEILPSSEEEETIRAFQRKGKSKEYIRKFFSMSKNVKF